MDKKTFEFQIDHPGEYTAGINSYYDDVEITVMSGDPGGDNSGEDSFQEFMRKALAEWYDGAKVVIVNTQQKKLCDDEHTQHCPKCSEEMYEDVYIYCAHCGYEIG